MNVLNDYLKLNNGEYFFVIWDVTQQSKNRSLSFLFQKIDNDTYFNISCEKLLVAKDLRNTSDIKILRTNEESIKEMTCSDLDEFDTIKTLNGSSVVYDISPLLK